MKVKVIVEEDNVSPLYIDLPRSVSQLLGWFQGDELSFEPVVDKQGKVTHVVLEKRT